MVQVKVPQSTVVDVRVRKSSRSKFLTGFRSDAGVWPPWSKLERPEGAWQSDRRTRNRILDKGSLTFKLLVNTWSQVTNQGTVSSMDGFGNVVRVSPPLCLSLPVLKIPYIYTGQTNLQMARRNHGYLYERVSIVLILWTHTVT